MVAGLVAAAGVINEHEVFHRFGGVEVSQENDECQWALQCALQCASAWGDLVGQCATNAHALLAADEEGSAPLNQSGMCKKPVCVFEA